MISPLKERRADWVAAVARGEALGPDFRNTVRDLLPKPGAAPKINDDRDLYILVTEQIAYVVYLEVLKALKPAVELLASVYLDRSGSERDVLAAAGFVNVKLGGSRSESALSMDLMRDVIGLAVERARERIDPATHEFLMETSIEVSRNRARAAEASLRNGGHRDVLNRTSPEEVLEMVRMFDGDQTPSWVKYWFLSQVESHPEGIVIGQAGDQDYYQTRSMLSTLAVAHQTGDQDARSLMALLVAGISKHSEVAFYRGRSAFKALATGWAIEPDGDRATICPSAEWYEVSGLDSLDGSAVAAFRECLSTFDRAGTGLRPGMSPAAATLLLGLLTFRAAFGDLKAVAANAAQMTPKERRAWTVVDYTTLEEMALANGFRVRTDAEYLQRTEPTIDLTLPLPQV